VGCRAVPHLPVPPFNRFKPVPGLSGMKAQRGFTHRQFYCGIAAVRLWLSGTVYYKTGRFSMQMRRPNKRAKKSIRVFLCFYYAVARTASASAIEHRHCA
jgi:hypothetical protein